MFVWADIPRLRAHLALLHKQEREAQALSVFLNQWLAQALQDPSADISLIRKQQQTVRKELENIRRRADLLESAAERLSHASRSDEKTLNDLNQMLSSYQV